MKTLDDYFIDWESHVFGFGYGTGEEHIIPALKAFIAMIPPAGNSYKYTDLEVALGPAVAWLFINVLCHADLIEYGTSPRFGWLTPHGIALKQYLDSKTSDELEEVLARDYDLHCYPDHCNCIAQGESVECRNPFWHQSPAQRDE